MHKLTVNDLTNISGTVIHGYNVEEIRVKRGNYSDSDNYGFILGKNHLGNYVTWQFHLDEQNKPKVYWGHYFMEDHESAIRDFNIRDMDAAITKFKVTITENLKLTVDIEAKNQQDAEQLVFNDWHDGKYVLNADNFEGVAFQIVGENQGVKLKTQLFAN